MSGVFAALGVFSTRIDGRETNICDDGVMHIHTLRCIWSTPHFAVLYRQTSRARLRRDHDFIINSSEKRKKDQRTKSKGKGKGTCV